jgi:hypothetical protein
LESNTYKEFWVRVLSHVFRAGARNNLAPEGQETTLFGSVCSLAFLGQGQEMTLPLRGKKQPFWVRVLLRF